MHNFGLTDRLISILSYYTFGGAGIVWFVICALTKTSIPKFTKYHILQSILLSIILYLLTLLLEIGVSFTISVPYIGEIVKNIVVFTAQTPIYLGFSLVHYVIFMIIVLLYNFIIKLIIEESIIKNRVIELGFLSYAFIFCCFCYLL